MITFLFIGFIGIFIHRYKLFKLLVSYSIAAMGLNLFFVLAGNIHFDCNVLLFTSLLWGLEAAETAVVLFLFIVTANCLAIINIKLITLYLLGTVGLFALMDRLVMGAFQRRSGPYSIGWFGLLQPIVDGIKLIKKESIIVQK